MQSYATLVARLAARFHQDFTTNTTAASVTNVLLTAILTKYLTAPVNTNYGLGLALGSLPAKTPQMTTREFVERRRKKKRKVSFFEFLPNFPFCCLPFSRYLDILIGVSGTTAANLGLRLRVNFELDDSHKSSPVDLNILCLQGFYAGLHAAPQEHQ